MMRICRRAVMVFALLFGIALGIDFCNPELANATGYSDVFDTVDKKGHTQNVYRCYKNGDVKNVVQLDNYSSIQSLLTYPKTEYFLTRTNKETCKKVFNDYKSGKAPSATAGADKIEEFFKKMGYTVDKTKNNKYCHYLVFEYNGQKNKASTKVCQTKSGKKVWLETWKATDVQFYWKNKENGDLCLRLFGNSNHSDKNLLTGENCKSAKNTKDLDKLLWSLIDADKWCPKSDGERSCKDGAKSTNHSAIFAKTIKTTSSLDNVEAVISKSERTIVNSVPGDKAAGYGEKEWKALKDKSTRQEAGATATKYLTGASISSAKVKTSSLLGRLLYQGYVRNYFNMDVYCKNASEYAGRSDAKAINWYPLSGLSKEETKTQTCYYLTDNNGNGKATRHKYDEVHGLDEYGYINGKLKFQDVLNALSGMKTSYSLDEVKKVNKDITAVQEEEQEEGENGNGEAVCYEKSGALGWILCPVIKGLSAAGEAMWAVVSDMLNIPANETFNNSNGGVYEAWEIIRNIANVVFIILFLLVIFSQLTGIGIDNYGIKKILPKIIVAAILMNLSYVLCEVAVDISNILGNGLNQLFANQAGTINLGAEAPTGSGVAAGVVDVALVGAGAYLYVLFNPLGTIAIGIAVISVIISIVTAVAFLYLILVIRQAGVILMVVLAPVAIACYMLPNTEKIYKKWFDLFKALLIVYPICGAIVGAGALASAVLGSIDNTAMKVAAMIVQVVPFFLIPTLLRQSLSLMGNIGASLQNMAGRVRRGATGAASNAMRNSEALRSLDNKLGMHSLSSRRRAAAFESEMGLRNAKFRRGRNSDVEIMKQRLADADANNEEKAINEDIERKMSSMQRNGIVMGDSSNASYSLENAERRVGELEKIARGRALSNSEQLELAALSRGMVGMKGGAGKLAKIVRHAGETRDGNGNVTGKKLNANFMSAMGDIYSRDNDVKNKMNEKDMGASIYTEQFMPGASADNRPDDVYSDFTGPVSNDGSNSWKKNLDARIKTYSAGLSQSGEATQEYLKTLTKEDCERIVSDEILYNGLDNDNRAAFDKYAKDTFGIERSVGGSGSNGVVAGSSGSAPDGYEERDSGFIVPHSR